VALTKIRKLVERDRAQAIVGLVLSAAALAVAESLTLQQNPYVFRLTYSAAMTGAPIGQWTYRHLKARKAAIIASDSVGPLELTA
jgi:ABC-type branched-subunit amino acid transport system substrate-binding protein